MLISFAKPIRGLLTKGDIDLVVRSKPEDFPYAQKILDDHFEKNLKSTRSASFSSYFVKGSMPDIGIQLVTIDYELDKFHILKDVLMRDVELRDQLNDLKRHFEGKSMTEYRAAKSSFIEEILRLRSG